MGCLLRGVTLAAIIYCVTQETPAPLAQCVQISARASANCTKINAENSILGLLDFCNRLLLHPCFQLRHKKLLEAIRISWWRRRGTQPLCLHPRRLIQTAPTIAKIATATMAPLATMQKLVLLSVGLAWILFGAAGVGARGPRGPLGPLGALLSDN